MHICVHAHTVMALKEVEGRVGAQSLDFSNEGSRDGGTADWTTQYIHNLGTSPTLTDTVTF